MQSGLHRLHDEVQTLRAELRELRDTEDRRHADLLRMLADHDDRISRVEQKK